MQPKGLMISSRDIPLVVILSAAKDLGEGTLNIGICWASRLSPAQILRCAQDDNVKGFAGGTELVSSGG